MNATQGLVKAYRIDDAAGVAQYVAVVHGANDGCCKKPTGGDVAGFLGITLEAQATQNKGVAVQKSGIARVLGHGVITRGDRLAIYGATGDVYSVEALIAAITIAGSAVLFNVIGRAEESAVDTQVLAVWLQPETVITPSGVLDT
jgi:hypothetical protein